MLSTTARLIRCGDNKAWKQSVLFELLKNGHSKWWSTPEYKRRIGVRHVVHYSYPDYAPFLGEVPEAPRPCL